MKPKSVVQKALTLIFAAMLSATTPAWGGGYTVEQLFMLSLDELMEVTIEMVVIPRG